MGNVVRLSDYVRLRVPSQSLHIDCPVCHQSQKLALDSKSKVWFPVSPFCCEVMRMADTPDWNSILDGLIAKAINKKNVQ